MEDFQPKAVSLEGAISFTCSASETDGKKTVHLDCSHESNKRMPFGHIAMSDARRLRDWLTKVLNGE